MDGIGTNATAIGLRATLASPTFTGTVALPTTNATGNITISDATNIILNTTTGTQIGTATGQKLAFWGATPVVQASALTAPETTVTFVDENTPDFALSSLTIENATAGFATLDEAQGFVEMCVNMQLRISELETIISNAGLSA